MIDYKYIQMADMLQGIKDKFKAQLNSEQIDALNDASNALDDLAYKAFINNDYEKQLVVEIGERIKAAGGALIKAADVERIIDEIQKERGKNNDI